MTDLTPIETGTTFEDVFDGLAHEALSILYDRQRKYGPENIRQQGLWGILTRIKDDKIERARRAFNGRIERGVIQLDDIADMDDETWEDAMFDIANYSLISIALKRGVWGKPMREDTGEVEALIAAHGGVVPQITLTEEEEEAERAREVLAGFPDDPFEDATEGYDYSPVASIDDATPEEWDAAAASQMARERLERDRLARNLGGQD